MPWCDACAKFWSPASVPSGTCPKCGTALEGPAVKTDTEPKKPPKAPWHFKLMLVALVIYLSYRAYQGVYWAGHSWLHIF